MDLYKNLDRVRVMLLQTCGCSEEEAIIVCEKLIDILKEKADKSNNTDKNNTENDTIRNEKENKKEDKLIKGYKITRFKKPLLPIEERKVYSRVCRRCDKIYRTFGKYSWFCDKCKLVKTPNEAPPKK